MSRKTLYISFAAMLAMVFLFFFFVFIYVVPSAARVSIPYAWRNLPLKQDSSVVNNYLGEPATIVNQNALTETWYRGIKNQQYTLTIQFSSVSKLAIAYKIEYHFEKWKIQKNYLIEEFEISK